MASTFVNDLRLNEMATGDESGNWGVVTNQSLELIGEALGFGTEGITTNADTHTSTIADGATDPVRAMYVKYTGTLDSACTITIGPNTINRMHFIENGTSGSQNIIISQGSGANITIPPGDTKAVYLDGAGSGAAVVDAFASLSVVDLKVQDDLTVTDDATIGGTLGVTGVLTATSLDISGAIDVDGTSNLDVVDIDGAVDMASTLQVDGAITSSAGATITTADNSENLILKSTDADASVGPQLTLWRASGSPADDDLIGQISYNANDDGGNVTNFVSIFGKIRDASDGSEDAQLTFKSMVAGTSRNRLEFNEGEAVFNDDSVDVNFRVESDNDANALFVQGSDGFVGIGVASPASKLHVESGDSDTTITIESEPASSIVKSGIDFLRTTVAKGSRIESTRNASLGGVGLNFLTTANNLAEVNGTLTSRMIILESGNVGVGTDSPSQKLHVVGKIKCTDDLIIGGTSPRIDYDGGSTGALRFFSTSANTETMRLDSVGALRINNTSTIGSNDEGVLHLLGKSAATVCKMKVTSNSQRYIHFFDASNNDAGEIQNGGGASTVYATSSDYRMKENIRPMEKGLDRVAQLNPVKFTWKHYGIDQEGFIAHEAQEVFPDAVTGEKDGIDKYGKPEMQAMDYGKITPLLVKAIQEQQEQIEQLKTEISKLH